MFDLNQNIINFINEYIDVHITLNSSASGVLFYKSTNGNIKYYSSNSKFNENENEDLNQINNLNNVNITKINETDNNLPKSRVFLLKK